MHISETFALIARDKECDIFASLSREQRKEIRETIIQMVLSTDMKHHIAMLTELQANIEQKKAQSIWFDVSSRSDRLLLLKNCLHLSDVANPTKPTNCCVRWANAIVQEWFIQGDQERQLGVEISPMMDRRHDNPSFVPKSQLGFISFIVEPLYQTWKLLQPNSDICLQLLEKNKLYWQSKVEPTNTTTTNNTGSKSSTTSTAGASPSTASNSSSSAPTAGTNTSLRADENKSQTGAAR